MADSRRHDAEDMDLLELFVSLFAVAGILLVGLLAIVPMVLES
jgi:hypothetical protein